MPKKAGTKGNAQTLDVKSIIHSLNLMAKAKGLTAGKCAEMMRITPRHFRRIKKGEFVTMETLNGYANIFGLELRCQLYKKI